MILHLAALFALPIAAQAAPSPTPTTQANPEAKGGADYYTALCSLSGQWSGKMEQFEGVDVVRTFPFELKLECLSDTPLVIETSTFKIRGDDSAPLQTLRVIFPKQDGQTMHMSYFFAGMQKVFLYEARSVDFDNDEHWTIVRELRPDKVTVEAAAPESRYTHSRKGDQLTMLREINHAENGNWKLSSKLTLSRIP